MDQKFIDMAKAELGEDDLKRTQALQHFRDWLAKHPFLSGVRQGQFLKIQLEINHLRSLTLALVFR